MIDDCGDETRREFFECRLNDNEPPLHYLSNASKPDIDSQITFFER